MCKLGIPLLLISRVRCECSLYMVQTSEWISIHKGYSITSHVLPKSHMMKTRTATHIIKIMTAVIVASIYEALTIGRHCIKLSWALSNLILMTSQDSKYYLHPHLPGWKQRHKFLSHYNNGAKKYVNLDWTPCLNDFRGCPSKHVAPSTPCLLTDFLTFIPHLSGPFSKQQPEWFFFKEFHHIIPLLKSFPELPITLRIKSQEFPRSTKSYVIYSPPPLPLYLIFLSTSHSPPCFLHPRAQSRTLLWIYLPLCLDLSTPKLCTWLLFLYALTVSVYVLSPSPGWTPWEQGTLFT